MTTAKPKVNVKIDTSVKELASQLLVHMGLDQTTAIIMAVQDAGREIRQLFSPQEASVAPLAALDA